MKNTTQPEFFASEALLRALYQDFTELIPEQVPTLFPSASLVLVQVDSPEDLSAEEMDRFFKSLVQDFIRIIKKQGLSHAEYLAYFPNTQELIVRQKANG
ncbi:hypothetical protein WDW89_23040 [Deltaproteobacteria bacterium TL4]